MWHSHVPVVLSHVPWPLQSLAHGLLIMAHTGPLRNLAHSQSPVCKLQTPLPGPPQVLLLWSLGHGISLHVTPPHLPLAVTSHTHRPLVQWPCTHSGLHLRSRHNGPFHVGMQWHTNSPVGPGHFPCPAHRVLYGMCSPPTMMPSLKLTAGQELYEQSPPPPWKPLSHSHLPLEPSHKPCPEQTWSRNADGHVRRSHIRPSHPILHLHLGTPGIGHEPWPLHSKPPCDFGRRGHGAVAHTSPLHAFSQRHSPLTLHDPCPLHTSPSSLTGQLFSSHMSPV